MKENRTEPRCEVCVTARLRSTATTNNARISDLSNRGCYVDTIAQVTIGENLSIEILKPDGQWFKVQGVVAHHTTGLGFGVRFVNLDEKQSLQIRSLLVSQEASPAESPDTSASREPFVIQGQMDLTSGIIM